jgi:hypothetical protein
VHYVLTFEQRLRGKEVAPVKEKSIVNGKGRRKGIIRDFKEQEGLSEQFEELDTILVHDIAKSSDDKSMTFEQAVRTETTGMM